MFATKIQQFFGERQGNCVELNHRRAARVCAGLMGAIVGMVALVGPASAGCGLTLKFDNDTSKSITVLNVDAKASTGKWKSVYGADFTVKPNKKVTKAVETNASCLMPHDLRVKYKKGKNTLYMTKGPLATAVDKKYTFEFDD